jgi:hypothetical protein
VTSTAGNHLGSPSPFLGVGVGVGGGIHTDLQQGDERQLHGGWVASRVGHDARFLDRLAVELSEAVRHFFLEVQGRVRSTIPAFTIKCTLRSR